MKAQVEERLTATTKTNRRCEAMKLHLLDENASGLSVELSVR